MAACNRTVVQRRKEALVISEYQIDCPLHIQYEYTVFHSPKYRRKTENSSIYVRTHTSRHDSADCGNDSF